MVGLFAKKTKIFIGLWSLLSTLYAAHAQAKAFDFNDTTWEGTREFLELARSELGSERVKLVATLDYSSLTPADGVLVLHPETTLEYDQVSAFLRAGGRLGLLDDHGRGDRLLERFQIHRIVAPRRPRDMLRDNPGFAIAVPATQTVAGVEEGRHPIVSDLDRLVTNYPAALSHPDLTPVLTIPAIGEPDATLAVTGIIVNRGRLFAMADPSAVINLMLRYPGNRAFCHGLVRYLVEDDSWGSRSGTLYLLSNDFSQKGSFSGDHGLSGEAERYVENVRSLLETMHEEGLPDIAAVLFAAVVGLGALGWTLSRATRVYRRQVPRYAAAVPLVAQPGAAGRAAVLAAPTTHRALSLLELKAALEEGIADSLGLGPGLSADRLVQEVQQRDALSAPSLTELEQLLQELRRAEAAVAASRPYRVSAATVQHMGQQVMTLLAEIEERTGSKL